MDGKSLAETICGAPPGTLTQLRKPASSTESLSISPSTLDNQSNNNQDREKFHYPVTRGQIR